MAYDDEPYWYDKNSKVVDLRKRKKKPHDSIGRFIPAATDVMEKIERQPRAPEPSPLLKEWMDKQSKESSKD